MNWTALCLITVPLLLRRPRQCCFKFSVVISFLCWVRQQNSPNAVVWIKEDDKSSVQQQARQLANSLAGCDKMLRQALSCYYLLQLFPMCLLVLAESPLSHVSHRKARGVCFTTGQVWSMRILELSSLWESPKESRNDMTNH